MSKVSDSSARIKNIGRPFSRLFRLLKRYDSSLGKPMPAYTSHEFDEINQPAEAAIDVLLQDLERAARFFRIAISTQKMSERANQFGYLISAISKLSRALNDLKSDTDHVFAKE